MSVTVEVARCDGNGECVKACAFGAIEVHSGTAVVFDNCTDCGACVLACGPGAIWSELFSNKAAAAILAVGFAQKSGIAGAAARVARSAGASASWIVVDPIDAAGAADAIVASIQASENEYALVVLPHASAGPAIAARVAAQLDAHLLAGCSDIRFDDAGHVRATKQRFGGIVKTESRSDQGLAIATVIPRGPQAITSERADQRTVEKTSLGASPEVPVESARRIVAVGAGISPNAEAAARTAAELLGARILDPAAFAGAKQPLSPDLYVAIGVDGGTDHNAAFRNARVVSAFVTSADAPIAQIADYIVVGDIEEHVKAFVSAL